MLIFPVKTADLAHRLTKLKTVTAYLVDAALDNISTFPSEVWHLLIFWDSCLLIPRALQRLFNVITTFLPIPDSCQLMTSYAWALRSSLTLASVQCEHSTAKQYCTAQHIKKPKTISRMWSFKNQMPLTCTRSTIWISMLYEMLKTHNIFSMNSKNNLKICGG